MSLLPVHGFVLAGGKSRRMGVDKATLEFAGRAMVEIAVEKLRGFCADVSIVGERADLAGYAEVVRGEREGVGPGAGIEAGLLASRQEWAMFVPVDVPLVPGELLRAWAVEIVVDSLPGLDASYLLANKEPQPGFCLVRRDAVRRIAATLDGRERRLEGVLRALDVDDSRISVLSAERFAGGVSGVEMGLYFSNLNTPYEFDEAELWAAQVARG